MIKNYIKIAFRGLWNNKLFSFINIFGLGLAMAFSLISLIQIQNVFEFDNFHPYPERTYRILTDLKTEGGDKISYAASPFLLSDKLGNEYAGIERTTRVVRYFEGELNNRLKSIRVNGIYVDPQFFKIFGFPLQKGSYPVEPRTLVLTHETAAKFFGTANPVGKTISHPDLGIFTISGVLKPFKNRGTHFRSDVMVSMATFLQTHKEKNELSAWKDYDTFTFALLDKKAGKEVLDRALTEIAAKSRKEVSFGKSSHQFRPQRLSDISPDFEGLENNPYVDSVLSLFSNFSMAFMLMLLAGFNYVNLTLAKSLNRAKEVGVRKVTGAVRWQLVMQFLTETVVLALFALLIAFLTFQLLKMNIHVGWLAWEVDNNLLMWLIFLGFAVFTGAVAGILPARILSAFQPVQVLKGELGPRTFGKLSLRKSLIVIQFVVTLVFMFFITTMYSQFDYMATENENFNRKNILNLSLSDNNYQLLANEISRQKGVEQVGAASGPFGGGASKCRIKPEKGDENRQAYYFAVNKGFVENMNLSFVSGENLPESSSDSATGFVVLNERAVKALHLGSPQEAVGKSVFLDETSEVIVQGVVRDFCFSNYHELAPLVMQYNPSRFHILSVKTGDGVSKTAFESGLTKVWKHFYPYEAAVFAWSSDELYERYFPGEDMKFLGMITVVAFVIAVMGLLGMVTYSTEKRTKEIGIRKVMGADVSQIVKLLSGGFLKLLLIAALIALPLGYVAGFAFLNVFTFHTGLNSGLLLFCFVAVFFIAILTVGLKTYQAAQMDPAKSLRSE